MQNQSGSESARDQSPEGPVTARLKSGRLSGRGVWTTAAGNREGGRTGTLEFGVRGTGTSRVGRLEGPGPAIREWEEDAGGTRSRGVSQG